MAVTTFSFTTVGTSSWTVPNYTGSITIEAISGGGGACVGMSVGGGGAQLAGTCTLSPGTTLTIIAGEGGSDSWNEAGGARRGGAGGGPTGWNGGDGGDGTGSWIYGTGWPGGGGGSSAVVGSWGGNGGNGVVILRYLI